MTPENKKLLLRIAMVALLIGIWIVLLAQPEELVLWFWLVPIPLIYIVYEAVLHGSRCSHCGLDFGLKEVKHTPGGSLSGGQIHLVCISCGEEETRRSGTGH